MQQPTLARVESGKTASLRTLRRLADALNADVRVSIVPRPTGTLHRKARVRDGEAKIGG